MIDFIRGICLPERQKLPGRQSKRQTNGEVETQTRNETQIERKRIRKRAKFKAEAINFLMIKIHSSFWTAGHILSTDFEKRGTGGMLSD